MAVKKKAMKPMAVKKSAVKVKSTKPLVIPVLDLYDGLRGVRDGASKDDSRPHIACVHVCSKSARNTPKGEDGQLDLVATNGHVIYIWRQQLKGASDRAFNLTNRAVARMLRELTDIQREYADSHLEPEEPTITFFEKFYRHSLGGEMRLDVVEEKFPPYEKIMNNFKSRTTAPPKKCGISTNYLVQVCKNLQRVTKNKSIGVHMEFEAKVSEPDLPMMRFTVPAGDWNLSNPNATRQLVCFVMPMRI